MTVPEPRLPLSYVTRDQGVLRLQLQLREEDAAAGSAGPSLRLRELALGAVTEPVPVARVEDPPLLTAELASAPLVNGIWQVELADEQDTEFEPVHARVLVCDPNPISLLLGPTPRPRRSPGGGAGGHPAGRRATLRVARALSGTVDRILLELPPARAQALHGAVRRTARRIVP